ncbi:MAG: type II toxin-antitoxin system mRNA interferase toxin, RelE/StbE family [Elusimicrobiota bacterium]
MSYTVLYHHLIYKEDIPLLNKDILQSIKIAIELRLMNSPEQYGRPLRKTLKGYWKLRVRDYRVVYKVVKNEIHIFAIAHRSKVYQLAEKRIKQMFYT